MGQNNLLYIQITTALYELRAARTDGNVELIAGCQRHFDKLIDRLETAVSV